MGIDISDFAKLFGSALAFVVVLYVGIIFYRRESNFSDEYSNLIAQYKIRNEELALEVERLKDECVREISVMRSQMISEKATLEAEISVLRAEIEELRKYHTPPPPSVD